MLRWFQQLDRLLRGELTQLPTLKEHGLQIPLRGITTLIILLGATTGLCMGTFAILHPDGARFEQLVASTTKVPALFLLTLIVTFPSLYVFNALVGSRLRWVANLRLLVGSLGVTLSVLASLGPIVAFFSVSTSSYPFIILLNVTTFGIAGVLGLAFLLMTLHRLSLLDEDESSPLPILSEQDRSEATPEVKAIPSALERMPRHVLGQHVKTIFRIWVVVFGLVGAQMSWVLRPFIGNPNEPFTWFRPRSSNFFAAVWNAFWNLF